jgi:uracil-DNA glycosylase family 4
MFTGDRSGDFLYGALYRAGLANRPLSSARDDGLELRDVRVSAAVRCAPPANKPTPAERDRCRPWSVRELELLERTVVIVCLGAFAWNAALGLVSDGLNVAPVPRPRFGHGAELQLGPFTLLGCFHPSQQNTFTGRLTPTMIDAVIARALAIVGDAGVRASNLDG